MPDEGQAALRNVATRQSEAGPSRPELKINESTATGPVESNFLNQRRGNALLWLL